MQTVIVDTGPLVAYLHRDDQDHAWVRAQFKTFRTPLLTRDAVLSEAAFLLSRLRQGIQPLLGLLERSIVIPAFSLSSELQPVCELIRRYEDLPISLADACLIRMAEVHPEALIFTLDSDFNTYRKNRRQVIPLIFRED